MFHHPFHGQHFPAHSAQDGKHLNETPRLDGTYGNLVRELILSSLDLRSHVFSGFFQARCKSPFGKASVLAFATIVNDVSLAARIKFLYPLLLAAFT